MSQLKVPRGVEVRGPIVEGCSTILSEAALQYLAHLHRKFEERRQGLLRLRDLRQAQLDAGVVPTFLEHTKWIRDGNWKGPHIPQDLLDRRVEITGPVDRKMIINALNSGASVFMADFEDATCPTWANLIEGQHNLCAAVTKTITLTNPDGKVYRLNDRTATLMVRPRGWHLDEEHLYVDGHPISGSLFDFGLFFFHNAQNLIKRGSGPYFYLPKMESHLEARLWNDVFVFSQEYIDIPRGTIRATVLVETILAAFEMDEILYELREHSAGMNCGRWDYIFSFIKKFRNHPNSVLPDRLEVVMTRPWMSAYVNLLIQICHKRGVHAMGGMAAQIPVKSDAEANRAAMDKVRADKLREVKAGHDGTWVAHPALIPLAKQVFDEHMKTPNQLHVLRQEVRVQSHDLINLGEFGNITEKGLRSNITVGLQYLEAWLRGVGCVPLYHLMEDAATAEISRTQVWQWLKHQAKVKLDNNQMVTITPDLVSRLLNEEVAKLRQSIGDQKFNARPFKLATTLYADLMLSPQLADFMTSKAYPHILTLSKSPIKSNL